MHLVRVGTTALRLTMSREEAAHVQDALAMLLRASPTAPRGRAPWATWRRLVQQLARELVQPQGANDVEPR
jgi:hypothetical protein